MKSSKKLFPCNFYKDKNVFSYQYLNYFPRFLDINKSIIVIRNMQKMVNTIINVIFNFINT